MKGLVLVLFIIALQQYKFVLAAPSIESCPHDSIQVADTCKCNPELCAKPPCLSTLTISTNGTDTPGNCCPIYRCEGCTNDSLISGECPCAPGAILNPQGLCKCVDPSHSLIGNKCVCNPNLCALPQLCDKTWVAVAQNEGCCTTTKCIKCPEDSYATSYENDAIEDKCVCYPCNKECPVNEITVIIKKGKGFPGSCCDLYSCVKGSCTVGNASYGQGESWETLDGQRCYCKDGLSFCDRLNATKTFLPCHKEGMVYQHNESWMVDSCTNCTCDNGEPKCIAHFCHFRESEVKKPECPLLKCNKNCTNGYKFNKKGCITCKCNNTYKYDDILRKFNISNTDELNDILKKHFDLNTHEETNNITTTIVTPIVAITNNISKDKEFTQSDFEEGFSLTVVIAVVVLVGVAVIACLFYFCIRRNLHHTGSYNTNPARSAVYEQAKSTTEPLFNNNYIKK